MAFTIYHNPRCTKSRQTLELLREKNVEPKIIEYLQNPPTEAELAEIIGKLGISPRELIRKKEAQYKENGLDNQDLSDEEIIAKLCEFPKLIERPIVVKGDKAVIGRPPENALVFSF